MKKGQAEHLFSDAIPGILFILFGVLLITFVNPDAYEGLNKAIDERMSQAYAERQLIAYLQTPVMIGQEKIFLWQAILGGRQSLEESRVGVLGDYRTSYTLDYSVVEDLAWKVFPSVSPSYENTFFLWSLRVRYDDGTLLWIGNAGGFNQACDLTSSLYLPGNHDGTGATVELHSCWRAT